MGAKEEKKSVSRLDRLKQREPGRVKLSVSQPLDDLDRHPVTALISAAKAQEAAHQQPVDPTENTGKRSVLAQTPSATPLNTPLITPLNTPPATPLTPSQRLNANSAPSLLEQTETKNTTAAAEQELKENSSTEETRPRVATTGKFEYLDATHTGAEQRIYSVMYRRTISAGQRERHFGMKDLLEQTGIKAQQTIRTAIDGLIAKKSIEITEYKNGNPFGPRYRVYEPREITKRREASGITIDAVTKKIRGSEKGLGKKTNTTTGPSNNPSKSPTTDPSNDPSKEASTNHPIDPSKNWRGTPLSSSGDTPLKIRGVYINSKNDIGTESGLDPSSSSISNAGGASREADEDDGGLSYLDFISEVYERATGNTFTSTDARTALSSRDIPAEVWGIAICFCVDRAPGHRFNHLSYVTEEARNHFEEMRNFTSQELCAIMWRSLKSIERARERGLWNASAIKEDIPNSDAISATGVQGEQDENTKR